MAVQRALDCFTCNTIPPRARFCVNQIAITGLKSKRRSVGLALHDHGSAAGWVIADHDRFPGKAVVDNWSPPQRIEIPEPGVGFVGQPDQQVLVALVQSSIVGPGSAVKRGDRRVGMSASPGGPVRQRRREHLQFLTLQGTFHCGAQQVAPLAARLFVDHDQTAVPEEPRDGEGQRALSESSGIHDTVVAEVSPSCGDRLTGQNVVEDFPVRGCQHVDRITARLAINDNAQHQFIWLNFVGYLLGSDRSDV